MVVDGVETVVSGGAGGAGSDVEVEGA